jgi:kynureninase
MPPVELAGDYSEPEAVEDSHGTERGEKRCHFPTISFLNAFSLDALLTIDECRAADRADPLADRRVLFDLPSGLIYLDGNSLGPPTKSVAVAMTHLLEDWRNRLIDGWWECGWVDLPHTTGQRLEPIVGGEPGSIVCTDSTSVNLFKVVTAMCDLRPGDILTDSGNFPSCLYVLESIAHQRSRRLRVVEPDEVLAAINRQVGVVSLTQVDFRSGRLHDMEAITRHAAEVGARTVWDLSHSAGVVPIALSSWGVDAAVGCGYKYLNGGPGAPAYLYVSPRLFDTMVNPINGWFSHRVPFAFSPDYAPANGIERMLSGTPNIVSMVAFAESLKVYEGVRTEQIWEKSRALTSLFIDLIDREIGCAILTPRDPDRRGSQVSLLTPQAEKLMIALRQEGVIADFRPPDVARFGFSPLFIGYEDVWRAVMSIKGVLSRF